MREKNNFSSVIFSVRFIFFRPLENYFYQQIYYTKGKLNEKTTNVRCNDDEICENKLNEKKAPKFAERHFSKLFSFLALKDEKSYSDFKIVRRKENRWFSVR